MLEEFTRESVCHRVMSAVNALAFSNMRDMSVTPRTSHREISLLKREQPSNMLAIDFAELVSHLLRWLPVNWHVPEHATKTIEMLNPGDIPA